jgi:hypothetical protein
MPLCHRFDALFATRAGFESGDNAAPTPVFDSAAERRSTPTLR